VLQEAGLAPEFLDLELTESMLLTDAEIMLSRLQRLKATGLKLTIDDFGTGYSSFNYLKHFQVHKLKIDRSFMRDVMSKYPPAEPGALVCGPLEAAVRGR